MGIWKLVIYIGIASLILAMVARHLFVIIGRARTRAIIERSELEEKEDEAEGSSEDKGP